MPKLSLSVFDPESKYRYMPINFIIILVKRYFQPIQKSAFIAFNDTLIYLYNCYSLEKNV